MDGVFEKHKDRRIKEMHDRFIVYKMNKKEKRKYIWPVYSKEI